MASDRPPLRGDPDLRSFRVAAMLALPALAVFLPEAQGHHVVHLGELVAVLAAFEVLALGVSFTPLARNPHRLGFVFTITVIIASIATFHIIRGDPAVTAAGMLALLGGTLFFFSWTAGEALVLLSILAAAFGLAVGGLNRSDFLVAPMIAPWYILLGGGLLVVAASRFIGNIRGGLAAREGELATLSERLMSLQEDERRRLSHELHDGLGQSITAILSHLWLIDRRLPPDAEELHRQVAETRRLASTTLSEVRELSQLLRPSVLDDYGLGPSLDSHVKAFEARHHIKAVLELHGVPERLPAAVETAVYRIAQEALTNVARHSRATQVGLSLAVTDGKLTLRVADDGIGLSQEPDQRGGRGLGLLGIRERVRALGGTCAIASESGTRLEVTIPLERNGSARPPLA